MFDDKVILCGSSSYEKIFYFNPEYDSLPKQIKQEHQIISVLITDFFFDEIGSVLKIKQLRAEKRELLENMETYFRVFFLQEGQDVTGN